MQGILVFAALTSLLGGTAARADFVLSGPSPPQSADLATDQPAPRPTHWSLRTRAPAVAQGFGRRVPLAFAVRQIVPTSVHVSYAPGVNTGAQVDWTGGAPWEQVLRSTIEPLGLRLLTGRGSVELRR